MTALVVASFAAAVPFREGIARLRAEEQAIVGLWSPMAAELPAGPDDPARGLWWTMAAAGIGGAGLLYGLIWWSAVIAYPFASGGRPLHSWPAFLIAPIEVGALVAAFAGFVGFLRRARLTRLHDGAFDIAEVERAAQDRFVIAVRCDAGAPANALIAMLGDAGAVHSRLIER